MIPEIDDKILNVIYGYYIKYDRLKMLIDKEFVGSSATEVDIYVDVRDIILSIDVFLKRLQHMTSSQISYDPACIVAGLINLCAHYRNFFKSYYGVHARVIFVEGADIVSINNKWCNDYMYPQISEPTLSYYVNNVMSIMNMLVPYIPDAEIHHSQSMEYGAIVLSLIRKINSNNPSFIISKDTMAVQNVTKQPNVYMMYPYKSIDDGDQSVIINRATATVFYFNIVCKKPITQTYDITYLMAYSKVPARHLQSAYNYPSVLKAFSKEYESLAHLSARDFIYSPIWQKYFKNYNPDKISCRFTSIDYFFQSLIYDGSPEISSFQGFRFLRDEDSVKTINNEYFSKFPLDLNVL